MPTSLEEVLEKFKYKENEIIVSIDVGINNMAIISAIIENNTIKSVETCDIVNIKDETEYCCNSMCKLQHGKNAIDWVGHFLYKYKQILDQSTVILIEQQPPGGLQHIEILIIKEYRNKIINISPRSLHTWMLFEKNISYEKRKEKMVIRAEPYLKEKENWKNNIRQHDIADALCFILFYLGQKQIEEPTLNISSKDYFSQILDNFRYQNNLS